MNMPEETRQNIEEATILLDDAIGQLEDLLETLGALKEFSDRIPDLRRVGSVLQMYTIGNLEQWLNGPYQAGSLEGLRKDLAEMGGSDD